MALYHFHGDIIGRSAGRSVCAGVAYRAGEKIIDERTGITHDYRQKTDVIHTEIILPSNAPERFSDRATLWNEVERAEKRKDSQTARTFDFALQTEFDYDENLEITRRYVWENFVRRGMCADIAIHDGRGGNPHVHVTLTTRDVSQKGFGEKNRDWNQIQLFEKWRENWADICNEKFKEKGLKQRINHKTLKAQGIDREPTIHVGVAGKNMEKRGVSSERAKENREITQRNRQREEAQNPENIADFMHELKQGHTILDREITSIKEKNADIRREIGNLKSRAKDITEQAEHIKTTQKHLEELEEIRQNMGFFTSKKEIKLQIEGLNYTQGKATQSFERVFKFAHERATVETLKIKGKIEGLEQTQEELQNRLAPLLVDKEAFASEYHRQKLLTDIHRDRERIENRLKRLEDEIRKNQSVKENLAWQQSTRQLNIINERDFQRGIEGMNPKNAEKLLEHKERKITENHAKIIEKAHTFTHSL